LLDGPDPYSAGFRQHNWKESSGRRCPITQIAGGSLCGKARRAGNPPEGTLSARILAGLSDGSEVAHEIGVLRRPALAESAKNLRTFDRKFS
jgi:hypothetical protein